MEDSGRLLLSLATREGARSLWASEAGKCGVVGHQKALLLPLLSLGEGTVISHREDFLLRVGVGGKAAPLWSCLPEWGTFPKVPVQNPRGGGLSGLQVWHPEPMRDPGPRCMHLGLPLKGTIAGEKDLGPFQYLTAPTPCTLHSRPSFTDFSQLLN